MILIVTGSVGSGKTTLSKELSKKLDFQYLDVSSLVKENKLYDGYDKKCRSFIVDIDKLNKFMIKFIEGYKNQENRPSINNEIKFNKDNKKFKLKNKKNIDKLKNNGLIIDSHLSHYLPKKYVDKCIVTKCDLNILNDRLKKRNYTKSKIRENLDVEIFDVCYEEALQKGYKPIIIDTSNNIEINKIISTLKKSI